MKGFILSTTLVREEDKIVKVLTTSEILTLYRFYGARHSQLQWGNLIDFVVESNPKGGIARLRTPIQLPLLPIPTPLSVKLQWEEFFSFLNFHLRGVTTLPPFYYHLLFQMGRELTFRPPIRVVVEGLFEIFHFEGRLPPFGKCAICHSPLTEWSGIERGSLRPVHPSCLPNLPLFPTLPLGELYLHRKSLLLSHSHLFSLWKWITSFQ